MCVLMGGFSPAGPVWAQAPLPPPPPAGDRHQDRAEDARREELQRLSREVRDLGREYLELLNELKEVMKDYNRYLAEAAVKSRSAGRSGQTAASTVTAEQKELQVLMERLAAGAYLKNALQLEGDLSRVRAALDSQREAVRADRRAYALSENLGRSLEAITIQLESELADLPSENDGLPPELYFCFQQASDSGQVDAEKLRQVYVRLLGRDGNVQVAVPDFDFTFDFDPAQLAKLEYLDSLFGDSMCAVIPQVYVASAKPPAPPRTPVVVGDRNIVFTGAGGKTEVVREYGDSLRVASRAPITITNPNGDLRLIGWDRELLLVRGEITLGADSRKAAEALAEEVRLRLERSGSGYEVGYLMPELRDTRQKAANRTLTVMVPQDNPLIVTSPFGSVVLESLENDVMLTTEHADVTGSDIVGRVGLTCQMGSVRLTGVEGHIAITARRTPVELQGCDGEVTIDNEYASVQLAECAGPVDIRNSGQVRISYHQGDISVDNSNGQVEVQHSEGNCRLTSRYQPMQIAYVKGSVTAENSHAPIVISDITGRIEAGNSFAPIQATDFSGPISLTNSNGPITVSVSGPLQGPSAIRSTGGVINLTLEPGIDLLMRATAVDGKIESSYPLSLKQAGTTTVAELALGKARPELTITGTRTRIVVGED
ncbi:MAG: hypothetical protein QUT27_06865 [candidate division Zixibacteria bacterium]|nr:hypothetical protein [candidate division Zixibacteria bacterium]HQL23423.1 hypothetical protein [candidate division Zixibacteria bacterium]